MVVASRRPPLIDVDQKNDRARGHDATSAISLAGIPAASGSSVLLDPAAGGRRRREHLFGTAPAPVAFGAAGDVHSSFCPEVEQILQRSDRERRSGRPRQLHQRRCDLPDCRLPASSGTSTRAAAATPLGLHTSHGSWGCHESRYRRPCWERSCAAGTGSPDRRRTRTGGPVSREPGTGRGAHQRPA